MRASSGSDAAGPRAHCCGDSGEGKEAEEPWETESSQSTFAERFACSISTSRVFSVASFFASTISCCLNNNSCVRSTSSFYRPSSLMTTFSRAAIAVLKRAAPQRWQHPACHLELSRGLRCSYPRASGDPAPPSWLKHPPRSPSRPNWEAQPCPAICRTPPKGIPRMWHAELVSATSRHHCRSGPKDQLLGRSCGSELSTRNSRESKPGRCIVISPTSTLLARVSLPPGVCHAEAGPP